MIEQQEASNDTEMTCIKLRCLDKDDLDSGGDSHSQLLAAIHSPLLPMHLEATKLLHISSNLVTDIVVGNKQMSQLSLGSKESI